MSAEWSTAVVDWRDRIISGKSLVPTLPLDRERAEKALRIFRRLRLVRVRGEPTMGEACPPWVFDWVGAIFGAYDPEVGRQIVRESFLLVAKKNGKSSIAAGIMLTALIMNDIHGGEYLILAPTKDVADNSFEPAVGMVEADKALKARYKPSNTTREIVNRLDGSVLAVKAADADVVGGQNAVSVLVDELWLFGKKASAENMLSEATGSLASQPAGFVIYLSTQSDEPPAGVFRKKLTYYRNVRDGRIADPTSLPLLFEYPLDMTKQEAWRDPATFYVPNPSIDRSVDRGWLESEYRKRELEGAGSLRLFLAKHLNVEVGVGLRSDGWAGAEIWERGFEPGLNLDALLERCEVVTIGIDGGGLDDLLGVAVIGRDRNSKHWLLWAHAFISPEGWERRKANEPMYQRFVEDGDLTLVDELPQDLEGVVEIVRRVEQAGLLAMVGADKYGIGGIVDALAAIGVTQENGTLGGVAQGSALMGAFKTVERKIADGTFRHGGQAMMAWCAGNAKLVPTATAVRIAREASGYGKIDPLMAAFDAADLMATNPEPRGRSYLDTADELALV